MKSKIFLIGMICTSFETSESMAQSSEKPAEHNNLYMSAEFGKTNKNVSVAQGGISLQLENTYYKIKASTTIERYEEDRRHKEDPVPGLSVLNFMIGKSYNFWNIHQFQMGTGLAVVNKVVQQRMNEPGYYEYHNKYKESVTVGLPVEFRYNLYVSKRLAFSCAANANANPLQSFSNASVGLMLGVY